MSHFYICWKLKLFMILYCNYFCNIAISSELCTFLLNSFLRPIYFSRPWRKSFELPTTKSNYIYIRDSLDYENLFETSMVENVGKGYVKWQSRTFATKRRKLKTSLAKFGDFINRFLLDIQSRFLCKLAPLLRDVFTKHLGEVV